MFLCAVWNVVVQILLKEYLLPSNVLCGCFLLFFFLFLPFFSLFWYLLWKKVPSQLVALATNDFLVFIYSFLYLNIAPNLSALCCLMWQGPKLQWVGGYSFDYTNGIFNLVLVCVCVVFLEVIFSRGTWWDHIEPHILFTAHHGRNYSLVTVWLKKWRQLCLHAGVWYLGTHEAIDFCYELKMKKKEVPSGAGTPYCQPPATAPSRSWCLNKQCIFMQSFPSKNQVSWQDMSDLHILLQVTSNIYSRDRRCVQVSQLGQRF